MSARSKLYLFLVAVVLLVGPLLSCAQETQIAVGGGTSPEFTLSGSGKLSSLKITGAKEGAPAGAPQVTYWQVGTAGGGENGKTMDELRSIVYGQVPPGYAQKYPLAGAVTSLAEGQTYTAEFMSVNAPAVTLQFGIQNGKAVNLAAASNHRNIPTH